MQLVPSRNDNRERTSDLLQRSALNKMKPCVAKECPRFRSGVSKFCSHHATRNREVGHPTITGFQWRTVRKAERLMRRWISTYWSETDKALLKRAGSFLIENNPKFNIKPTRIQRNFTQKQKAEIVLARYKALGHDPERLFIRWAALELTSAACLNHLGHKEKLKLLTTQMGNYTASQAGLVFRKSRRVNQWTENKFIPHGHPTLKRWSQQEAEVEDKPIIWRCPGTSKAIIGHKVRNLWHREVKLHGWLYQDFPEKWLSDFITEECEGGIL